MTVEVDPQLQEMIDRLHSKEPLHPDLVPYLEDHPTLGKILRHPLVFSVPFMAAGQANYSYEHKKRMVWEASLASEWHSYVFLHERPHRVEAFMKIHEELTDREYWELASSIWTDSENIHQNQDEWAEILGTERKNRRYFMDADERRFLRSLPERITIYRGCCQELNEDGWSYSLDRERAEWFAQRFDRGHAPIVIEAEVPKEAVLAYFGGRSESEIVAYPHRVEIVQYHLLDPKEKS